MKKTKHVSPTPSLPRGYLWNSKIRYEMSHTVTVIIQLKRRTRWWIFTTTVAETEVPLFPNPDVKTWDGASYGTAENLHNITEAQYMLVGFAY